MTRNEFVAQTAAKLYVVPWNDEHEGFNIDSAIKLAIKIADALEAQGVAPWQDVKETEG